MPTCACSALRWSGGRSSAAYDGPLEVYHVEGVAAAGVIEASVVAGDPVAAAELLDVYVRTFVEVRRARTAGRLTTNREEALAEIEDLDARIGDLRAPLDDLEARVAAAPGDRDLRAERDALAADLAPTLTPLEGERARAQSQSDELAAAIAVAEQSGEVVRPPTVPDEPLPVHRGRDLALTAGLAIGLALAAVFVREGMDVRFRSGGDVDRASGGLPTLAVVPRAAAHGEDFLAVRDDPDGPLAGAYRELCDAVVPLLPTGPGGVLQVTSAASGEGKSTVVANLGVALAGSGRRVAVIGCDLRRPSLHRRVGVALVPGLSEVLRGTVALDDALRRSDGLLVLTAGSPAESPSELLSEAALAAVVRAVAAEVDLVVMDCTPALPVSDAFVVAQLADATVVVVDPAMTDRAGLRRTLQQLREVHAPVVGVVINGLGASPS